MWTAAPSTGPRGPGSTSLRSPATAEIQGAKVPSHPSGGLGRWPRSRPPRARIIDAGSPSGVGMAMASEGPGPAISGDERADRQAGGDRRRRAGRAEVPDPDDPDPDVPGLLRGDPGGRLEGERGQPMLGVEDRRPRMFEDRPGPGRAGRFLSTLDPVEPVRERGDAVRRGTRRIEPEQMRGQRRGPSRRHAEARGQGRGQSPEVVESIAGRRARGHAQFPKVSPKIGWSPGDRVPGQGVYSTASEP